MGEIRLFTGDEQQEPRTGGPKSPPYNPSNDNPSNDPWNALSATIDTSSIIIDQPNLALLDGIETPSVMVRKIVRRDLLTRGVTFFFPDKTIAELNFLTNNLKTLPIVNQDPKSFEESPNSEFILRFLESQSKQQIFTSIDLELLDPFLRSSLKGVMRTTGCTIEAVDPRRLLPAQFLNHSTGLNTLTDLMLYGYTFFAVKAKRDQPHEPHLALVKFFTSNEWEITFFDALGRSWHADSKVQPERNPTSRRRQEEDFLVRTIRRFVEMRPVDTFTKSLFTDGVEPLSNFNSLGATSLGTVATKIASGMTNPASFATNTPAEIIFPKGALSKRGERYTLEVPISSLSDARLFIQTDDQQSVGIWFYRGERFLGLRFVRGSSIKLNELSPKSLKRFGKALSELGDSVFLMPAELEQALSHLAGPAKVKTLFLASIIGPKGL